MCKLPDVEWFKDRYEYNPDTGDIRRKSTGTLVADKCHGYLRIRGDNDGEKFEVRAHRVAWALQTGDWPERQIDHINGIRNDNRFCNLREVTHKQNQWNRSGHKDRKRSPYTGVQPLPNGKWRSIIMVSGRRKHLGVFDSADLAHCAYQQASREMRGEFSRI